MSIVNYPNRAIRRKAPAIDRVMAKRDIFTNIGSANVFSSALDFKLSANDGWLVDSIGWSFSNTATRNFSALISNGRKIVADLNDYLWFQLINTLPQRIILTPGFYTGTQLATQLKTQLDANPTYINASVTFTVTYTAATGLFTITPSSGTLKYLNINTTQSNVYRNSIAGHIFGLTATTSAFSATVTSDTAVFGLNSESAIVTQTGSEVTSYSHIGPETLSMDQALHLTSNSGADVTLTYEVTYEEIV